MKYAAIVGMLAWLLGGTWAAAEDSVQLELKELLHAVLAQNSQVQIERLLVVESEHSAEVERAAFVPEFFLSLNRAAIERENTTEQGRSQGFLGESLYTSSDKVYESGVEGLAITGMQYRIGFSMSDLRNSLNNSTSEYTSFSGIEVTQPLLRDAGVGATTLRIRLAENKTERDELTLKLEIMRVLAEAERLYWQLYQAQEKQAMRRESVATAQTILSDNVERVKAGKMASREVEQAKAGVELRLAQLEESHIDHEEVLTRLNLLLGRGAEDVAAYQVGHPGALPELATMDMDSRVQRAVASNPQYRIRELEATDAGLRFEHAKNQSRPKLDLVGRYGYNGLGDSSSDSYSDVTSGDHETWAIGVNLQISLCPHRGRSLVSAAETARSRSELAVASTKVELANLLRIAVRRVKGSKQRGERYRRVVAHNEKLLADELLRLEQGKGSSRMVLDAEEDLIEARSDLLDSESEHRLALVALHLIEGTILDANGISIEE